MCKVSSDTVFTLVLTAILAVIGYFLMETCEGIKGLEKEVTFISAKMQVLEATRITRADIKGMIAEYHATHPCIYAEQHQKGK